MGNENSSEGNPIVKREEIKLSSSVREQESSDDRERKNNNNQLNQEANKNIKEPKNFDDTMVFSQNELSQNNTVQRNEISENAAKHQHYLKFLYKNNFVSLTYVIKIN